MSFKVEFYDSFECDRCNGDANIHLQFSTKYAAERNIISLCWSCWRQISGKVERTWAKKVIATPEEAKK